MPSVIFTFNISLVYTEYFPGGIRSFVSGKGKTACVTASSRDIKLAFLKHAIKQPIRRVVIKLSRAKDVAPWRVLRETAILSATAFISGCKTTGNPGSL